MISSGFLFINKPCGPSSFDIIRSLRKKLNIKKMGHAGTLDPLASGLLIIAVGEATKLLPFLTTDTKTYVFDVQFGYSTTTDDREGEILIHTRILPDRQDIEAVLPRFTGDQKQIPPQYSAIKIAGNRAYKKARRGEDFTPLERSVTISGLELLHYESLCGKARFRAQVSSGTYIRSLARDMGRALGSAAHAASIHREEIGTYHVETAQATDSVERKSLLSPLHCCNDWTPREITADEEKKIIHGNPIPSSPDETDQKPLLLYRDNIPRALALLQNSLIHPKKVFPQW
ncbi:MAG: tRNA pseudouridine(55) synthase TruB [Fibrobacterota bacterium]